MNYCVEKTLFGDNQTIICFRYNETIITITYPEISMSYFM